jgi:hypothetical protein
MEVNMIDLRRLTPTERRLWDDMFEDGFPGSDGSTPMGALYAFGEICYLEASGVPVVVREALDALGYDPRAHAAYIKAVRDKWEAERLARLDVVWASPTFGDGLISRPLGGSCPRCGVARAASWHKASGEWVCQRDTDLLRVPDGAPADSVLLRPSGGKCPACGMVAAASAWHKVDGEWVCPLHRDND